MKRLPDTELEVMKALWTSGPDTPRALLEARLAPFGWAANTINTYLSRLADKGMLKTSKAGRRNEYIALVTEADYRSAQARTLVSKLYSGSAKGLVATLIQGEMLSEEEYRELKRFWESGGKEP